MYLLEAKNITKSYAAHTALKDVSIAIPKQSIFGLLGPNGAGKTTLIRIINQIIEGDNGEIFINEEKLNAEHIKMIGYLPEERGLYKKMQVGEQLIYLGQLRGLTRKQAIQKGKEWCKKLDILDWWAKKVEDLSKGMAQKIQFIATVMHEPELIILDEPFSGFDPVNANLIKDEILELRDKGATIIFSTHRMESVEQLCDHIAMINNSQKILDGSKKEIKNSFKSNRYLVEHVGEISNLNGDYEVNPKGKSENDFDKTSIRILNGKTPNDLISELIKQVEIHSFIEQIPSINEIFISKVKGGDYE